MMTKDQEEEEEERSQLELELQNLFVYIGNQGGDSLSYSLNRKPTRQNRDGQRRNSFQERPYFDMRESGCHVKPKGNVNYSKQKQFGGNIFKVERVQAGKLAEQVLGRIRGAKNHYILLQESQRGVVLTPALRVKPKTQCNSMSSMRREERAGGLRGRDEVESLMTNT